MSPRKHRNYTVDDVVNYSQRIRRDSLKVTHRDALLLSEVILSRVYLLRDLSDDPLCSQGYARAIWSLATLDARCYAEDVKRLRQEIIDIIPTYSIGDLEDLAVRFKRAQSGIHYKWMVTPLPFLEKGLEGNEVIALYRALQWVSYDTKLNMRDVDFSSELTEEYLSDEYQMSTYSYDEDMLNYMNSIIREWCESVSFAPEVEPWHFRHGNGATLEVSRSQASPIRKCKHFRLTDEDVSYLCWRDAGGDGKGLVYKPEPCTETPIRLDFVPKSPLTNRVISKEHVTKMWLQNDVFYLMDKMFRDVKIPIHLHDQEASRRMAQRGSVDGRYDTFDYSKASDFVTLRVVDRLTQSTWLHDPLIWTRSRFCEIQNKDDLSRLNWGNTTVIRLNKFAPMGSSTCFPTESLVFACLCEASVRRQLGRRSRRGDYLVYGDDVVIRSDCSDELRFLSSLIHFKVNDEKTCRETGSHIFREACGIEAIDGVDVTPLRVSRRFIGVVSALQCEKTTPGEFLGICDFINRCMLKGFTNLRKFFNGLLRNWRLFHYIFRVDISDYRSIIERIKAGEEDYRSLPLPYFVVPDGTATNYHCNTTNHDPKNPKVPYYMVPRTKVPMVSARTTKLTDISLSERDEIRLFLWLSQSSKEEINHRSVDDFAIDVERQVITGSTSNFWKWTWVTNIW